MEFLSENIEMSLSSQYMLASVMYSSFLPPRVISHESFACSSVSNTIFLTLPSAALTVISQSVPAFRSDTIDNPFLRDTLPLVTVNSVASENANSAATPRFWKKTYLEEAIKIVAEWTSRKGTPAELFMSFWDKNEELGYGHQD